MMARISAEEVANGVGLAADELSKPCDDSIIPSLADCFSRWRVNFGSLLSEMDLFDVDRGNATEEERRIAALRTWRARNGRNATYKVLVDALLNSGERYQAEFLCKILADHLNDIPTTDSDAKESIRFKCPCGECSLDTYLQEGCPKSCIPYLRMTTLSKEDQENLNYILKKDTKKIMTSFVHLSSRTCDSLMRQGITADRLVRLAVDFDSSLFDKLIGSMSVDRVFTILAPEMSFFDHDILTAIIRMFGDTDDRDRLASYCKELKEFCKRKVFEVEPGRCTCGQRLSQLKGRKLFAVVLPTGEKMLQNIGDAVKIKELLSDILDVPPAILHLHRIDAGGGDFIVEESFLQKKDAKQVAYSTDVHDPSSKHTPTIASGTPGVVTVPEEKQSDPAISISSATPQGVDLNWSLEQKPNGELVELGNGSYGKVYKGYCKSTGKHLAVKVVLDLTQKAADDLEKEVKQLSELNPHKRIVTYLGACYADHPRFREKCLYVFTEFMPGGSLSSCLEKRGGFTQALTRRYTRQILEGVEYLHHCKVIHRDIKGSNIMCDMSGNVKLADFGSAKQICSETLDKDKAKYMCGTAPWAAPEVLRGEKAQSWSDIWSVAATVVEMLTGAMPYKTEKFDNSMAIIFQVGGNKLNPLKSMKRGGHGKLLTEDTEAFLSKCFKSEAKERPSATVLLTHFNFVEENVELKKELQERDAQIETLRRKKGVSTYSSVEENDGASGREYVRSNSEEDRAVVTNWKFVETKLLGCGNFGIVFKGLCQDTGRELAVKIVRDLNDKTIKGLEQEYNMLSTLRHRRIVSYLGVCYQPHPTHGEECLFIMTEFMPGGSLADFYKEEGPLNEILTRRYTRQILEGVEYLHQQDIIHRDIKGSNIMRNTRGHVKLADFGSAKKIFSETSEKNKTSYLYGTAPWAAPEVLCGESAKSQSDIWSVAATVVEMMTAERPYNNIKENSAIIYLVGKNKLNPLQSVSVKGLIENGKITENAVDFLKECFKSVADERPAASDLLHSFNFCQKESSA